MTRGRFIIAVVSFALGIAACAAVYGWVLGSRIGRDEATTCAIQARGLPAGHELAASMADIHTLLTLAPSSKAQRLAAKNTPPKVKEIVVSLDKHLAAYQAAEAKQPPTRNCR